MGTLKITINKKNWIESITDDCNEEDCKIAEKEFGRFIEHIKESFVEKYPNYTVEMDIQGYHQLESLSQFFSVDNDEMDEMEECVMAEEIGQEFVHGQICNISFWEWY